MARFEFDATPSLSPTGAPSGDYENITASPAAFGGQKARALQTLGQGVENVGEAGFNVLKFHNKIASDYEQTNTFQDVDKMLYGDPTKSTTGADGKPVPDLGFMGLTGRDAADRREDTIKAIEERRQQGRNNLSSPEAQLEYDNSTKRYVQNAYNQIGRHSETQYKSWAADSNETGANQARNDFVRNLDNPQGNEAAARYIQFREQQAQVKYGNDPAILAGVKENARRDLLKAHVDAVAVYDAPGAMKILEKPANKDLAGDQFDNMYRGLEARANKQLGDRAGASALDKAKGGTFAPSTNSAIQSAATQAGVNPSGISRLVQIESGGNPNARTGSYWGLMQLSHSEFDKYNPYPGRPITDPQANLAAGIAKMKAEGAQFAAINGRQPSDFDSYMIHQQGLAGYSSHLGNPNAPAWQNMLSTGEGRQKGERWAKAAIWGNIPDQYKASFGNVDNVTSRDFISMWAQKYGGGNPEFGGGGGIPSPYGLIPGERAAAQPASFQARSPSSLWQVPSDIQPTGMGEGRGNIETATFPTPNVAASIRPDAMQHLLDDPELRNNPEAFARAETVVRQRLQADEIAEGQNAKVRKEANDSAAGDFTTELLNAQTSSKPDYVGMSNRIANDPRLDFKTKHELSQWVSDAAGGHAERTYGPGFWDIYKQIHAPAGDPGKITDPSQIYDKVRPGGPLTIAGADKAIAEIRGAKTPEGEAEAQMKKQFFEHVARPQITFTDQDLKLRDPKGDENFLKFMAQATALYDQGKAAGKTPAQLLDPESKDYVGRIIENFKSPAAERFVDRVEDKPGILSRLGSAIMAPFHVETPAAPVPFDQQSVKALPDLKTAYDKRQITAAQAREIAVARGWARAPAAAAPQVPTGP